MIDFLFEKLINMFFFFFVTSKYNMNFIIKMRIKAIINNA